MKNISRRLFLQNMSMGAAMVAAAPSFAQRPSILQPGYAGKKLNIAL